MFNPSAAVLQDFEQTANHKRICFLRPQLNRLAEYSTVVDMHFHSKYSDGQDDVAAIADRARSLGIGVAITDHNAVEGAVRMAEFKDVFSIPGIEVTSREGAHLLVYFHTAGDLIRFFEKELTPYLGKEVMSSCGLSMEAIVASARQYRSLVVFPHPYCAMFTGVCNPVFSRARRDFLLSAADGIEVINAGNIHRWNIKSALLSLDRETGLTGGSDGHSLFQLGRAVTCAPCAKNAESFFEKVKNAQTMVVGKEVNLLRKVTSSGMKIRSNLKNSQDILGKNVRYGYAVINSGSRKIRKRFAQNLQK